MKLFLLIFCFLIVNQSFAQSKIDSAKKKLEEEKKKDETKEKSSSSNSINESNEDDDSDYFLIEFFLKPVFGIASSIAFNHNLYLADELLIASQGYAYNPYPFANDDYFGIRNPNAVDKTLSNFRFSYGFNGGDQLQSLSLKYDFNFYGWKLFTDYDFINEKIANEDLQKFGIYIQRKSQVFNFMDLGLNLGYSRYSIGSSNYPGTNLGLTSSFYLFKPISFDYSTNVTFYSGKNLFNSEYALNYHLKNITVISKYQHLDILGVTFNTFHFGLGLYL
jgi:hypothetical protein